MAQNSSNFHDTQLMTHIHDSYNMRHTRVIGYDCFLWKTSTNG